MVGGGSFTQLAPEYGSNVLARVWMLGIAAIAWAAARLIGWAVRNWRSSQIQFIAAVLCLAAAAIPFTILLVAYIEPWNTLTVRCYSERHVIGDHLTVAAEGYVNETGVSDPGHLLKAVSCQPELVWKLEGIITHRQSLWRRFIPLLLLLTFILTWIPAVFIGANTLRNAKKTNAAEAAVNDEEEE